jgi:hypothetical protein
MHEYSSLGRRVAQDRLVKRRGKEKRKKRSRPPSLGCGFRAGETQELRLGFDEEYLVIALGIEPVEIGLDSRGKERTGQDETEDDGLRFSGPYPGPPCKCRVMSMAFTLTPLKTADRTTLHLASLPVRGAWFDTA